MPVVGRGHYKRPYRVEYVDQHGQKKSLAYHWRGARDQWAEQLRRLNVTELRVFDVQQSKQTK